ncbi:DUF72 domain-containing protein [Lysobacter solisilvae (ex Woo and Kim 2020)]|uniref:DUF72 domain-containing protein n=1 Tax=Agrilutibacter terrestris TaxID=2865112 RepID=A0A7H0FVE9_9GAMM|nr:DUF72 domain-containing protein [Lysobacter terrestris]QNP40015.1 DUF72 domain-containing protein [Lysobacter terrestris]
MTRTKPALAPFPDATPAIDGIRVGIGGWNFVPWRNNFYPAGLVQRRELEYASRQLSAIEINGTYYGAQKPSVYAKWAAETPEGFVFSLKAPMRIMQSRVLANTGTQVDDFLGGVASLGDRLGPVVWQFDIGRKLEREDFAAFLNLLPEEVDGRRLRHVLDVRDSAFVDARFIAMMRERNLGTVFTDSRDYPSFADLTTDFVYARLMRSRSEIESGYALQELEHWAQRARQWAHGRHPDDLPHISANGAPPAERRDVYVFFISAAKERNPAAAMALIRQLQAT